LRGVGCDYRGLSVLSRVTEAPHLGEVIMVSFPCQFTGALCVAANEIKSESAIALLCFGIGQHTQYMSNMTLKVRRSEGLPEPWPEMGCSL
jgi:hypothetical protein